LRTPRPPLKTSRSPVSRFVLDDPCVLAHALAVTDGEPEGLPPHVRVLPLPLPDEVQDDDVRFQVRGAACAGGAHRTTDVTRADTPMRMFIMDPVCVL
jgi:hypothetical protein